MAKAKAKAANGKPKGKGLKCSVCGAPATRIEAVGEHRAEPRCKAH